MNQDGGKPRECPHPLRGEKEGRERGEGLEGGRGERGGQRRGREEGEGGGRGVGLDSYNIFLKFPAESPFWQRLLNGVVLAPQSVKQP